MRFFFLAFVSAIVAVGCEKDQPLSDSTKKLTPAAEAPLAVPAAAMPTTVMPNVGLPTTANTARASEGANIGVQVEDREGEPMDDVDEPIPATDKSGVDKSGAATPKKVPPSEGRAENDPEGVEVDGEE